MDRRFLRRGLALFAMSAVAAAIALVPMTAASAHEVTDITASCDTVTVYFSGFPTTGVTVHIAAAVEGHETRGADVFVDNTTTQKQLDIASATSALEGTSANVDVDVTWTFEGPQHVHKSFPMTCGTATTSTSVAEVSGATSSTTATTGTSAVEGASATTSTTRVTVLGAAVNASPTGTSSGSLPMTGSATLPLAVFALAAIAAGTVLVAGRRRGTSTDA